MGDDDCNEAIHRLYHFLDGELTEDRRREIRAHLDDCGPCLEAFDFEAELRVMIAAKCRDEVPEHLRLRIAAAIRHEQSGSGRLDPGAPGRFDPGPPGAGPVGPSFDGGTRGPA